MSNFCLCLILGMFLGAACWHRKEEPMDVIDAYTLTGFIVSPSGESMLPTVSFTSFEEASEEYKNRFWAASHTDGCLGIEQMIVCGQRCYCLQWLEFDR